jgi:uncharacterized membrane protein YeaQ/YmgE (transglycosylase-associated protein family)
MGIIAWIIFGAISGWLASIIARTNERQGWLANIVVGMVGALVGGLLFNLLGGAGITGFNLWSLFVAVIGAVIFLSTVKLFWHSGPRH